LGIGFFANTLAITTAAFRLCIPRRGRPLCRPAHFALNRHPDTSNTPCTDRQPGLPGQVAVD
jgi:hypothetical protein